MSRRPGSGLAALVFALATHAACAESPPRGATAEFDTDFDRHSIPYDEILSGAPPKTASPKSMPLPSYRSSTRTPSWVLKKALWSMDRVGMSERIPSRF